MDQPANSHPDATAPPAPGCHSQHHHSLQQSRHTQAATSDSTDKVGLGPRLSHERYGLISLL